MEQPYLVVTVTISLYDYVTLDRCTERHLQDTLTAHGIDCSRAITWYDNPANLSRTYRQIHPRRGVGIERSDA